MNQGYKPVPQTEALRYKGTPEKPDIKIFVSHRIDLDAQTIDNPLYIPVRCGAVYDERENVAMLGDDTGDNISEKRMSYCELTVQYWAWKNVEADYYGLCHYRRYLSFCDENNIFDTDENGQIVEKCLSNTVCNKHNLLSKGIIKNRVRKYDIVYGQSFDITKKRTPSGYQNSVGEHWRAWEGHLIERGAIKKLRNIISKGWSKYLSAFDDYLSGKTYIGYNCYIMNKESFFSMCEFQFGVLSELEKVLDSYLYSETMMRTCGFMAEILYATFIMYQKKTITLELPIIFIQNLKPKKILLPAYQRSNVAVVLMSSDLYVPYLSVFLASMISKATDKHNYDIIILEKEITDENKKKLKEMERENISIRFFNPCYILGDSHFYIAHEVYAEEAYYRMLTPWILEKYDKAIVMDSDIIVRRDLADLYSIDVDGYLVGGIKDVAFQGILNETVSGTYEYVLNEMQMKDPYMYINTGVLLVNIKEWRRLFTCEYILKMANTKKFRIQEQDIINVLVEGKVKYLDIGWNYYIAVNEFLAHSIESAPVHGYHEYQIAGRAPYLLHYAGVPKPWFEPEGYQANIWWEQARKTCYYETCISRMVDNKIASLPLTNKTKKDFLAEQVSQQQSRIRDIADRFLPKGTRRREVIKKIMPAKESEAWLKIKKVYYHIFKNYEMRKQV